MIGRSQRAQALELLEEAVVCGARKRKACAVLGMSVRTVQRWQREGLDDRRTGTRARPANQLSERERAQVLEVLNGPEYCDKSPNQVAPMLAERGQYLASESTMYRLLRQQRLLAHRQRSAPARREESIVRAASAPNQLWSWDITYLRCSSVRGVFYYLYLILDVYSRKIVGFSVHERECAQLAAELATEACYLEGVAPGDVLLHADNGSPMKGSTMLATLQTLGIMPSFTRPTVSDDNPFSEALFRTLKYCPRYPREGFEKLADARAWVEQFVSWYNTEHRHSALKFVTPEQRHRGTDREVLKRRHDVYQQAHARHPERWSGSTRNWHPVTTVNLTTFPSRCPTLNADALRDAA